MHTGAWDDREQLISPISGHSGDQSDSELRQFYKHEFKRELNLGKQKEGHGVGSEQQSNMAK